MKLMIRGQHYKGNLISRTGAHSTILLPPSILSRTLLSKEKAADAEYKCGTQTKKRKGMELGAYSELGKILLEWFQQMMLLFYYFFMIAVMGISLFLSELD
jgi:hypothetical protein